MFRKILLSTAIAAALFAGEYTLDSTHSSVNFSVKHLMVSSVKGDFKTFDGNFTFDEKAKKIIKLEGIVDAASVDTGIVKRDDHLRSADFFDVVKFPKMYFIMTKYIDGKKPKVEGKLTIKGITKVVVLDADIGGAVTDPNGNNKAGFSLNGAINRKDFGLTWNKALESGGFVVSDDIKITIDIEGNGK